MKLNLYRCIVPNIVKNLYPQGEVRQWYQYREVLFYRRGDINCIPAVYCATCSHCSAVIEADHTRDTTTEPPDKLWVWVWELRACGSERAGAVLLVLDKLALEDTLVMRTERRAADTTRRGPPAASCHALLVSLLRDPFGTLLRLPVDSQRDYLQNPNVLSHQPPPTPLSPSQQPQTPEHQYYPTIIPSLRPETRMGKQGKHGRSRKTLLGKSLSESPRTPLDPPMKLCDPPRSPPPPGPPPSRPRGHRDTN
ncbi:hypothetical protein O3P69_013642 [Scylla paramamosain]|uniref:Uncharacterized protein n=1 Tax=Scylla paramamosain TaxID=85552 RepID=A0AAW0SPQ8_SCYPA